MSAQAASGLATPEQLELLSKYLCSERAPPTCMLISQLDGFLTAIAAGPQRVPANEWLPIIWGGAEPTFSDADQETAVIEAIMQRYKEIARSLEHGFVDPIYLTAADDTPIISHWAAGFLDAVRLRQDAWKPLLMSEWAGKLFSPILDAAEGEHEEPRAEPAPEEKGDLLPDAAITMPICAAVIATFWRPAARQRARTNSGARASATYAGAGPYIAPTKTGRNEPCPCGSGRKFKKCCGSAQKAQWSSAA
jgi:uncharacterized protein